MERYFDREENRKRLLAEAERWIGTKWSDRVFSVGMGTDCLRFILQIWASCGVKIIGKIPNSVVGRGVGIANDTILDRVIQENSHIIEWKDPQVGDVSMLSNSSGYRHYLLHISDNTVIHCDSRKGVAYRGKVAQGHLDQRHFTALCQEI